MDLCLLTNVRSLENMNPIPSDEGGNTYMVNGNKLKLKDVGKLMRIKTLEVMKIKKVLGTG